MTLNKEQQELLSAYLDDEVSETERVEADRLLEQPEAKAFVAALESTRSLLRDFGAVPAPADFRAGVLSALEGDFADTSRPSSDAELAPVHQLPTTSWATPVIAIAASLLVALGLVFGPGLVEEAPQPPTGSAIAREACDETVAGLSDGKLEATRRVPEELLRDKGGARKRSGNLEGLAQAESKKDLENFDGFPEAKFKATGGKLEREQGGRDADANAMPASDEAAAADVPERPYGKPVDALKSPELPGAPPEAEVKEVAPEGVRGIDPRAPTPRRRKVRGEVPEAESPVGGWGGGDRKKSKGRTGRGEALGEDEGELDDRTRESGSKSPSDQPAPEPEPSEVLDAEDDADGDLERRWADLGRGKDQPAEISLVVSRDKDAITLFAHNDLVRVSNLFGKVRLIEDEANDDATPEAGEGLDLTQFDGIEVELDKEDLADLLAALKRLSEDQNYGKLVVPEDLKAEVKRATIRSDNYTGHSAEKKNDKTNKGAQPQKARADETQTRRGAAGYLPARLLKRFADNKSKKVAEPAEEAERTVEKIKVLIRLR